MDEDLGPQVHELDRRLRQLEKEWSDARKADQRRRKRATWARVGLLIVVGGAYAWYLVMVTSVL